MRNVLRFLSTALLALSCQGFAGSLDEQVNYQGLLTDAADNPLSGSATITFNLYAVGSRGTALWTETHVDVPLEQGRFSVLLGSISGGLPAIIAANDSLLLGVSVDGGPEMTPLQPFSPTPYALRAGVADTVPVDSITGEMIVDGSITLDKLAPACAEGEVLQHSGGMWVCTTLDVCVPTTEICDGLDNNCDGQVDEGFPDLHQSCSVGQGACLEYGTQICTIDGLGTECDATPGIPSDEVCDGIDNNCDGMVDEPFVNGMGVYVGTEDCGACGNACPTPPNSVASCEIDGGHPLGASCNYGCDPGWLDLNGVPGDGCEFLVPDAIFVSTLGNDANSGAYGAPRQTITAGITAAVNGGKSRVNVASGIYLESVVLAGGISLYGGYSQDFAQRDAATMPTIIFTPLGGSSAALRCLGISGAADSTTVDGFQVYGASAQTPGSASYGIYVSGCDHALRLANLTVNAGAGAAGAPGSDGVMGDAGIPGNNGTDTTDISVGYGATTCVDMDHAQAGGSGGMKTCPSGNASGGNGGMGDCPGVVGPSGPASAPDANDNGANAADGIAQGGAGGHDWYVDSPCDAPFFPPGDPIGASGEDGSTGGDGGAGAGCTMPLGAVSAGEWVGSTGQAGSSGGKGGGGGGGGSGGGAWLEAACEGGTLEYDDVGATGGGGGSGGCGGQGGAGGQSGGASLAIFLTYASPPASLPTIENNVITPGSGGPGGPGGRGATPGQGGAGGMGGNGFDSGMPDFTIFPSSDAGHGGNGGSGGDGGGGGGGCGGSAVGIFLNGQGGLMPNWKLTNIFVPATPGAAGAGGPSDGNDGTSGTAGVSQNANF